ncbi:MAG: hypothetical protein GY762_14175 [Proteobacteria bacterium]|nr:hypothetical protein [Pseudomonadota bacterium]
MKPDVHRNKYREKGDDHLGLAADPQLMDEALYLLLEAPDQVAPPADAL